MEVPETTALPATASLPLFDDFFRDQFASVARTAALVSRDPDRGPDLAQEAFARAYERWDKLSSPDHARNFVYRVAVNLARSHVRRMRVRLTAPLDHMDRHVPDPSGASTEWMAVADALTKLPPRQRACVVLSDVTDLDAATIGRILGVSESTVRVHLGRARKTLRTLLATDEETDR